MVILGPNGSGKTTLLMTLCTILKPTSGTAKVMGIDVVKDGTKVREVMDLSYLLGGTTLGRTWKARKFRKLTVTKPASPLRARIMDREPIGLALRSETGLLCSRDSDSGSTTNP